MEGIRDKVAIIGMGCTKFGELWDKSVDDLIIDATSEACEDAGIELKDVQAAWLGTVFSGHTAVSLSFPLKLQYIPVTRVENMCATGTEAIRGAAYAVPLILPLRSLMIILLWKTRIPTPIFSPL